jgi:RNA polymerase sigma factor (sigma-70 family)
MLSQIEACVPALRRHAAALLRDRRAADDLVHDCLARAVGELRTRGDDGDVRVWLFAVLHGLFVSRRRRARGPADATASDDTSGGPGGAGEHEATPRSALVRELNNLPDDQRAAILLVSVEDLTYAEAARVLGVSVETVVSRLARGRERLRQAVQKEARFCLRRVK